MYIHCIYAMGRSLSRFSGKKMFQDKFLFKLFKINMLRMHTRGCEWLDVATELAFIFVSFLRICRADGAGVANSHIAVNRCFTPSVSAIPPFGLKSRCNSFRVESYCGSMTPGSSCLPPSPGFGGHAQPWAE